MSQKRSLVFSVLIGVAAASVLGLTGDEVLRNVYNSSSQSLNVTVSGGVAATSITSGTTTITSGADKSVCFDDSGAVNCADAVLKYTKGTGSLAATTFVGNVPVSDLNSGTSAGATTFWRGDGTWATPAGGISGTLTSGLVPVATGASSLGDSSCYPISITNDTVTGTTVNKLAKFKTSNGTALITATTETAGILGIVTGGAGNSGSAQICTLGSASCVFDNAVTAGHFVGVSTSVAGDCTDLGTNDFTAVTAGTTVLGTVTVTATAGTRAMFYGTSDVQGLAGGGGNGSGKVNGTGASGRTTVWSGTNTVSSSANNTYSLSLFEQTYANATTAADNTTNMFKLSGTMPAVPTATVQGVYFGITGAGSASQVTEGAALDFLAGYTGSSATVGIRGSNALAGTGATLNLNSNLSPIANISIKGNTGSTATAGNDVGVDGYAGGSTTLDIGVNGRAGTNEAGTHIGVLGNASQSSQATNFKNIGVYGTLGSALITGVNGSMAGVFDGGTLPDAVSRALYVSATLPSVPSAETYAAEFQVTGAGSASQAQGGLEVFLNAGYTGSSLSRAGVFNNGAAGTAATLNLSSTSDAVAQMGSYTRATGAGGGVNVGAYNRGSGSAGTNIGTYGWANSTAAGQMIGGLFNAGNSTEGTDFKNVALIATLHTALPTASNTSVAFIADGAGNDEIRGYNAATLNFTVASTGAISTSSTITSSATGALGWSIVAGANTACNTTCTSACVMGTDSVTGGFLACTDATADVCLCAGAS